jgi:alpha-1,6-mannosyltransferase
LSDLPRRLLLTGFLYLSATIALVVSEAPLGSPFFFVCLAIAVVAYLMVLPAAGRVPDAPRRLLVTAFLFALAFRVPLAVAPVGPDSDMVRYLWDGRVQHFGYNPYTVVPADASLAHTHTEQSRQMPSIHDRTPYPPAAQLFFRLIVAIHDSTLAMKLALVACDVLTIIVLWRWLVTIGRSPWLALVYAWNPLVILEVAHGGHVDALGALWITASAYFLSRRRRALAAVTFVLAIATKLLPIVLAPLYWKRIGWKDGAMAALLLAAMYSLFAAGTTVPLGALPNVVYLRFNGPVFRTIAAVGLPHIAAVVAVLVGLGTAVWARTRIAPTDPAGWAWPMAASLACAPVIYPWYLLYFTPFLWSRSTVPLLAWTLSTLPVYVVWDLTRHGGRWIVPYPVEIAEYAAVLASVVVLVRLARRQRADTAPTAELR